MVEITGEFDFFVAGSHDLGDRAFYVRSHSLAYGVELKADAVDFVHGVCRPCRSGRGRESCSDGSTDKSSSIHGRHFTPFERMGTGNQRGRDGDPKGAGPS